MGITSMTRPGDFFRIATFHSARPMGVNTDEDVYPTRRSCVCVCGCGCNDRWLILQSTDASGLKNHEGLIDGFE